MEEIPYNNTGIQRKEFYKKVCNESTTTQNHLKMLPECHNVTKQNCVTKWEADALGNQVRLVFYIITNLVNRGEEIRHQEIRPMRY